MPQKSGVLGVLIGVVALVCSCVALGIPYWQYLDAGTATGYYGLFRYTIKSSGGAEASGNYLDLQSGSDRHSLKAVWGLIISGAILLLFVAWFGVMFTCCIERKGLGIFTAVLAFLAAIVHTAGTLLFRYTLAEGGNSSLHAGFYLAAVTAGVAAMAGGFLLKAATAAGKQQEFKPPKPKRDPSKRRVSPVGVLGVVAGALALACSCVALGIPYWQNLDTSTVTGNHGLFSYSFESGGNDISGNYIDYVSGSDRTSLRAVLGLLISGAILLLLVTIFGLMFVCCIQKKGLGYFTAVMAYLSALLHTAGTLVFRYTLAEGGSSLHAGFYLATVAAALSAFAGGFLIKAAKSDDNKSMGITGVVLAMLAMLCCALALGLQYWRSVDTDFGTGRVTGNVGLFRYKYHTLGTELSGDTLDISDSREKDFLWAVRVLVIGGCCCLVLAIVALLVYLCRRGTGKWLGYIGGICCIITAALLVSGVVIFAVEVKLTSNTSFYAAFYLAIVTAVVALIAGVLAIVDTARSSAPVDDQQRGQRRNNRSQRAPQTDRPSSNYNVNGKVVAAGVIAIVTLVLSAVSLATPYWQNLDLGTTTSGKHGLFRYNIIGFGVEISGDYLDLVSGDDKDALYAVRGLVGSGTALTLLACIAIVVYIVHKEKYWTGFVGAALCYLSGAVHVTAVIVFRVKLTRTGSSGLYAGFYLAIVVALLACIAGTIVVVMASIAWYKLSDDPVPKRHNQRKPQQQRPTVTDRVRPAAQQHRETTARNDTGDHRQPRRQEPVIASPISDDPEFEDDFEFDAPRTVQHDTRQKFQRQNKVIPTRMSISTIQGQFETGPRTQPTKYVPPYSKQAPMYAKPNRTLSKPAHSESQWPKAVMSETEMDLEQRRHVWQREAVKLGLMKY